MSKKIKSRMGKGFKYKFLALLRSVNVGGKNVIKMTALKTCFEKMGFSNIETYIQSGNVMFWSDENDKNKLVKKIEKELFITFNYNSLVVLFDAKHISSVIEKAPPEFGKYPDKFKYNVLFLKENIICEEEIKTIKVKEGVDKVYCGSQVIYTSQLKSKAGQSYLSKINSLPVYKLMTIRNWNTTTKLFELMNNE
jgi:uncharacterized protein (DUF1697 family)